MNVIPNLDGGAPVLCKNHEPGGRKRDSLNVCRHCRATVVPVFCEVCDGRGFDSEYHTCPRCVYGIKRWRAVP